MPVLLMCLAGGLSSGGRGGLEEARREREDDLHVASALAS